MGKVELGLLMFSIGMAAGGAAVGFMGFDPSEMEKEWLSDAENAFHRAGGGIQSALLGLLMLFLLLIGSSILGIVPWLLLRPHVPEWVPSQAIVFPVGLVLLYLLVFKTTLFE